jgi:hypothetical protein
MGVAEQSSLAIRVVYRPLVGTMGVAELPPWPNRVVKATPKGFGVALATFKEFGVALVLPIWAHGGGRTTPMGHEGGLPPLCRRNGRGQATPMANWRWSKPLGVAPAPHQIFFFFCVFFFFFFFLEKKKKNQGRFREELLLTTHVRRM